MTTSWCDGHSFRMVAHYRLLLHPCRAADLSCALRTFLLFLPWNFLWLQIKCGFWTEHIENPISKAEPIGISIGIILEAFDDAVPILNQRIIHFSIMDPVLSVLRDHIILLYYYK